RVLREGEDRRADLAISSDREENIRVRHRTGGTVFDGYVVGAKTDCK
ncbi:MAG: hypothetical protein QOJ87_1311, partial [Verrucomicrobiota bacterium]